MSDIEIAATLFGVANILLIIRRSVWNFPFALAMVTLYGFIFAEARLYSDAGLQIFFFIVNLYGWWSWSRSRAEGGTIRVRRLSPGMIFLCAAGSAAATLGWGGLMARLTDATHPFWDASIAMLSVTAQLLMAKRYLENWWWWIAVNALSIPLYLIKGLALTAALYGLFLVLALWGLIEWRRAGGNQ